MQLSLSTRHGHLSEPTQEKIKTKAAKLSRYLERLSSIEIIVDLKDQNLPRVDVKVSAEHKHDFVSHSQADSLFGAVDDGLHKIEQQLRRYKQRVQQRNRNPEARRQEIPATDDLESLTPDDIQDPESDEN